MSEKFHYTMDRAGVTEILKSSGVKTALAEAAKKKTAEANVLLNAHNPKAGANQYAHDAASISFTAIESIHTTGKTTELDHAKYRTLNAINH